MLKAAQEVEDALAGFLNAQEAVVFEQNAVDRRRSARWSWRWCSTARAPSDYQRVLDAQRSLLQEQNSLAQTSSSVATNLIALYKALGGGWELRQGPAGRARSRRSARWKQRTNWGDMLSPPRAAGDQRTARQPGKQ